MSQTKTFLVAANFSVEARSAADARLIVESAFDGRQPMVGVQFTEVTDILSDEEIDDLAGKTV